MPHHSCIRITAAEVSPSGRATCAVVAPCDVDRFRVSVFIYEVPALVCQLWSHQSYPKRAKARLVNLQVRKGACPRCFSLPLLTLDIGRWWIQVRSATHRPEGPTVNSHAREGVDIGVIRQKRRRCDRDHCQETAGPSDLGTPRFLSSTPSRAWLLIVDPSGLRCTSKLNSRVGHWTLICTRQSEIEGAVI
jgi:hypothetical protein